MLHPQCLYSLWMQALTDTLTPEKVERAFFCLAGNAKEYRKMADLFNLNELSEPVAA